MDLSNKVQKLVTWINEIEKCKIKYCAGCGKCGGSCLLARVNPEFSPRIMAEKALFGFEEEIFTSDELWACSTCYACNERCPSGVKFAEFIRASRVESIRSGFEAIKSHWGILSDFSKIMANSELKQKRLNWIPKSLSISKKGSTVYWVGCLPYFDVIFQDIELKSLEIATGAIKIMNQAGISPVVLDNETCCGHDSYWSGEVETFEKLAGKNIELLENAGAQTIVTSCPECYRTLKEDYPDMGKFDFEVRHTSEFILDMLEDGKIEFKNTEKKVTYHDPCRLGRHLGIYEEPRRVLELTGTKLIEMERNKTNAACCGLNAWVGCNTFSRALRVNRLDEACRTGADILITACPKCLVHFNCLLKKHPPTLGVPEVKIIDLTAFAAESLVGE